MAGTLGLLGQAAATSMQEIDKRGRLEGEPFSYQATRQGLVFIYWNGKRVMTIKGKPAANFLRNIGEAGSQEAQLLMARTTGNFKHGNER